MKTVKIQSNKMYSKRRIPQRESDIQSVRQTDRQTDGQADDKKSRLCVEKARTSHNFIKPHKIENYLFRSELLPREFTVYINFQLQNTNCPSN